ncbi:hypothetical protein GIB67_024001 [Kingdonia uniflora]|uniref:MLO-like protein n=1 Tax=Kingdonia uniflora TaxID=39325 RepID=A0A7J7LZZ0_9MAGN|nr:hypothetical protein GIB67_024001 [Kingdonia uniflora]
MSISSLDDYIDQYYLLEVRVRLHETEPAAGNCYGCGKLGYQKCNCPVFARKVSLVVDGMRESVIVTVQRVMQDEDEEEEETKMHTAYVHIRNGPSYLLYTTTTTTATTTATTIFIIIGVQTMERGSHNMVVEGRSLADTPTWFVASVTTVMVFLCLFAERSIYRFGKWLKKTRRKALHASLEKIKEELMLLGLISLMLGQWAKWISEICVDSSLFSSKLYLCSEEDYDEGNNAHVSTISSSMFSQLNHTSSNTSHTKEIAKQLPFHTCGKGREPFVSLEGLEQLHRFLFVLGITHVLYSCVAIGLAMIKIYSWRKWESQFRMVPEDNLQVMLVGTKLQHVVSLLALEIGEPNGPFASNQVKPRDGLFWFRKPEILLWLIQFISFQNSFEMATFVWSLWGLKQRSCFMKNHAMISIRLTAGYVSSLNILKTILLKVMGSRCKKALIAESVRDSLHNWCKRVKERKFKHNSLYSHPGTARSTCSLKSIVDDTDEIITIVSGTLSRCSSTDKNETVFEISDQLYHGHLFRSSEYPLNSSNNRTLQSNPLFDSEDTDNDENRCKDTLLELFKKT